MAKYVKCPSCGGLIEATNDDVLVCACGKRYTKKPTKVNQDLNHKENLIIDNCNLTAVNDDIGFTVNQKIALCSRYARAIDIDMDEFDIIISKTNLISKSRYNLAMIAHIREPLTATILAMFFGGFGADRFYVRDYVQGTIKLLLTLMAIIFTFVGMYESIDVLFIIGCLFVVPASIWAFIDVFYISHRAKKLNYNDLIDALYK